jgi:predicted RNase H-like HicB family nuclease
MLRHNHDDDWKKPIRSGKRGFTLYEASDQRRARWDEPPAAAPLAKAWEARAKERNRLEKLERELTQHKDRLEALERRGVACQMEIHTFVPELYRVKRPIPIVVREHDGEFLASFVDANVNASGETAQEAFESVKVFILDMLDHLSRQARLGPKLAKTLAVLREFIDGP